MQDGDAGLKLLVQGFTLAERQLLDAIVNLSKRRHPHIALLSDTDCESADVVMIDAADPSANRWADNQPWLADKAVIWVDGRPAPGRTVVQRPIQWPVLPMMLAHVLEQVPANGAPAVASKNNTVLVVDDSLAVRNQLRSLLEPQGLIVIDADNAEAALKATSDSPPYACILMDVLMPGIDGYEACRLIKERTSGGKNPTVVMLTSRSSPFDRIRGKMAGCDAYLTKPVNADHLLEVVSRYIAKPSAHVTA